MRNQKAWRMNQWKSYLKNALNWKASNLLLFRAEIWDLSNEYLFELCKSRNIFICFDHIKLCDDICSKGHDGDLKKRQYSMMKFFHEQDPRTLKKYIEMENIYLRYNVKNWWDHYWIQTSYNITEDFTLEISFLQSLSKWN